MIARGACREFLDGLKYVLKEIQCGDKRTSKAVAHVTMGKLRTAAFNLVLVCLTLLAKPNSSDAPATAQQSAMETILRWQADSLGSSVEYPQKVLVQARRTLDLLAFVADGGALHASVLRAVPAVVLNQASAPLKQPSERLTLTTTFIEAAVGRGVRCDEAEPYVLESVSGALALGAVSDSVVAVAAQLPTMEAIVPTDGSGSGA